MQVEGLLGRLDISFRLCVDLFMFLLFDRFRLETLNAGFRFLIVLSCWLRLVCLELVECRVFDK